jgi:hypothetical protein
LRDVLLRLSHGMMRRPTRSEPIAVLGKRRIPLPLQNLHHRLLDEAIQYGRDVRTFQRPRGPLSCGRRVVWQRGSRELLNQNLYSCGAESGYEHRQKYQSYGLAPGHLCF